MQNSLFSFVKSKWSYKKVTISTDALNFARGASKKFHEQVCKSSVIFIHKWLGLSWIEASDSILRKKIPQNLKTAPNHRKHTHRAKV